MGALLVLALGLDAATVEIPTFTPAPGPVEYQVVVATRAGEVLGAFRHAVPESITDQLDGIGEHVFTWSPRIEDEPGADLLITLGGALRTWADSDVEVAVYRSGALAAIGPVITHDWLDDGRIRTTCWSREAYLSALVVGGPGRLNLFGAGDWSNGFSWTEQHDVIANIVTDSPMVWRTTEVLELAQAGGRDDGLIRHTLTLPASTYNNRVHFSIPAGWTSGGGWGGGGDTAVARIVHSTIIGDERTRRGVKWLILDEGAGPDTWYKLEESMPEVAGARNEYAFTIYAPQDGIGRIGEVEVVRAENVSARAGWDKATLIAALFDDARPRLPGGELAWNRSVTPTGELLTISVRYDDADHPDVVSVLRDWEELGTWWVPLGTRLICWAPTRGSAEPVMVLTRDNAAGLTLTVDGSDSTTEVVVLADGQSGPTREEGGADDESDLHLMSVHRAPLGLQPRMLDEHAASVLARYRPAAIRVSGAPVGPSLPGHWWHRTQPGDRVRARIVDGLLDVTVDCRIEARTLDCRSDEMTPTLSEALP